MSKSCLLGTLSEVKSYIIGTATVRSSDMDLTLMICLLRNLQKMKIEDILPAAALTSEEADLSRIKYYRNWIVHNTDGYINRTDFLLMWTNVCDVN